MRAMKFEIKNRWSGEVQFTAEIEADENASLGFKIGLAVKWAIESGAKLGGANLRGADLGGANLRGANLRGAYLGGANLRGAYLGGANLGGASLRGAYLGGANLRGAYLGGANLGGANLRGAYLGGANLRGANLRGADLGGANLRGAYLGGADLGGAYLGDANLRGANLGGANLGGAPFKIDNIHQAVFNAASQPDALNMRTWHTCDTTHCRAGWVVHLAGDAGRTLEWAYGGPGRGTSVAAALIYLASDPSLERVPDFHCNNETALADMKRLADLEAAASRSARSAARAAIAKATGQWS